MRESLIIVFQSGVFSSIQIQTKVKTQSFIVYNNFSIVIFSMQVMNERCFERNYERNSYISKISSNYELCFIYSSVFIDLFPIIVTI